MFQFLGTPEDAVLLLTCSSGVCFGNVSVRSCNRATIRRPRVVAAGLPLTAVALDVLCPSPRELAVRYGPGFTEISGIQRLYQEMRPVPGREPLADARTNKDECSIPFWLSPAAYYQNLK